MTIAVGTVCYLRGDHSRAGQCCTITSGPRWSMLRICANDGRGLPPAVVYSIELASGEPARYGGQWAARRCQLVPLTPPGVLDDTDTPTTKREPATV